jgi:hypothetical protein
MVKTLEDAIAALSKLPDDDQEQIGRKLLTHVERISRLRAELDNGIRSLNAGDGEELDIDRFLSDKRTRV